MKKIRCFKDVKKFANQVVVVNPGRSAEFGAHDNGIYKYKNTGDLCFAVVSKRICKYQGGEVFLYMDLFRRSETLGYNSILGDSSLKDQNVEMRLATPDELRRLVEVTSKGEAYFVGCRPYTPWLTHKEVNPSLDIVNNALKRIELKSAQPSAGPSSSS